MGAELLFLVIFLLSIKKMVYECLMRFWLFVFLYSLKLMLIFTFLFDYQNVDYVLIEVVQQVLMLLIISVFVLGIGL